MVKKQVKSIKVVRKREPLNIKLPKRKNISSKSTDNIIAAYIESVQQIRDLVQLFASLPEGSRRGIAGERSLTTKEKKLLDMIQKEQRRADKLLSFIAKLGG